MDAELAQRVRLSAKRYRDEFDISTFPISPDGKQPAVKWSQWRNRYPTDPELSNWGRNNIAICTGAQSNLVVVDCDTVENANWWIKNRGKTPSFVRTRRGIHFYFKCPTGISIRNSVRVTDEYGCARYDIRGEGGYVLGPPSYLKGHQYHFLGKLIHPSKLPVFDPNWLPPPKTVQPDGDSLDNRIRNGEAYIAKIVAISGSGGDRATWQAVNDLRRSGLDATAALAVLCRWNQTNAKPPWTLDQLLHKVRQCYESSR